MKLIKLTRKESELGGCCELRRRMKTSTAGRRLRQSELDQYNASALYGHGAVNKATHDALYPATGGGAAPTAADLRNNEYARMRLQRFVGQTPYRDAVPCGPQRDAGLPYGLPCGGGRPSPPLATGVVEHIYESPDLVRRDAAFHHDEPYTPTNAAPGPQRPQSPHRGYWPLPPATSHAQPASPGAQCRDSPPQTGTKAKNAGNYSL